MADILLDLMIRLLVYMAVLNRFNCYAILTDYDFNKLKNAIPDAFADDGHLVDMIMTRMGSFKDRVRGERSSVFVHPLISDDADDENNYAYDASFEPPMDFHSVDGINLDFGDSDKVVVDDMAELSVTHWDIGISDLDVVELDDGHLLWVTTGASITSSFYPRWSSNVMDDMTVSTYEPSGIQKLEVVAVRKALDSVEMEQLHIAALSVDHRSMTTIESYIWNRSNANLYHNGTLHFYDEGVTVMDISMVHMPVTDTKMLASLQNNIIAMFEVTVDQAGQLQLVVCTTIPIVGATDLESFSINGQTYIAVTNGHTTSIWKHWTHDNEFVLHQRLKVTRVSDVHYFRIGYEHFLAVADGASVSIYQWRGAIFARIQNIDEHGGGGGRSHQMLHSMAYGDKALLALLIHGDILFFSWDKRSQQFAFQTDAREKLQRETHHSGLSRVASFQTATGADHVLLLVATTDMLVTLDVHVAIHSLSLIQHKDGTFNDMANGILNELHEQEAFLNGALQLVTEMKTNTHGTVEQLRSAVDSEEILCLDLDRRLDTVEHVLRIVNESLAGATDSKTDTLHLKGGHSFQSVVVLEEAEMRGSVHTYSVNGIDVTRFIQESLMKNTTSHVFGTKTFTGHVLVEGDLLVEKSLNGHHPDNFVRVNRPQTVQGVTRFLSSVMVDRDIALKGAISGIDLSEEAIFLHPHKPQHVMEHKVFTDNITVDGWVMVAGKVNDIKLSKLAANSVMRRGHQRIRGKKMFSKMIARSNVQSTLVNGLDLQSLDSVTVRTDRPATIVAPKTFLHDVIITNKGLLTTNTINGQQFPEDFVHISEEHVALKAGKHFRQPLVINGDLTVKGMLDGVNLADLFLTNSDQFLCGNMVFEGPVHIGHMVNNLPLDGKVAADTAVVHGDVHLGNTVNDIDLRDVVLKNESILIFHGPVTFSEAQIFQNAVQINGRINELDLKEDFLHFTKGQLVTGHKVFLKSVVVKGDLDVDQMLDGVDLKRLKENILLLSDNTNVISGKKTFIDGFSVEDDLVLPSLDIDELSFGALNLKKCFVRDNLVINGNINGHNFQQLYANRMTLTTDQEILGRLDITGDATFENLYIRGTVNGHNMSTLWRDILWKTANQKQIVTGKKHFANKVKLPVLFKSHGINGLHLQNIKSNLVNVLENGVIAGGPFHFDGGLIVDGALRTTGNINGIDFSMLAKNAMMRHHPHPIMGVKVLDELNVKGNIRVAETVNGLVLQRDVLTVNLPQDVTGNYRFCNNVRALEGVRINLAQFGELHIGGHVTLNTLITSGNLNGLNLKRLKEDAVLRGHGMPAITGSKSFGRSITFTKNLTTVEGINGLDYARHLEDIVIADGTSDQIISGEKVFLDDVSVEHNVHFEGAVTVSGRLNNMSDAGKIVDMSHVVNADVLISGSLSVKGDVVTGNTLNGINVHQDIITISDHQKIKDNKKAKLVRVEGDVNTQSVNNCDLRALEWDTLTIDGDQMVTGRKVLNGTVALPTPEKEQAPATKPWNVERFGQISFHGTVNFSRGVFRGHDHHLERLNLAPTTGHCDIGQCEVLVLVQQAAAQKALELKSSELIQEFATAEVAAVEVLMTPLNNYLITGSSGCNKPVEVRIWDTVKEIFWANATLDVHAVYKMKTLHNCDSSLLIIHHNNCQSGTNQTSIYAVNDENFELKAVFEDHSIVDWDANFLDDETLVIIQISRTSLLLKRLSLYESCLEAERWIEMDIPMRANSVRWMAFEGQHLLLLGSITNVETGIYSINPGTPLVHLNTLKGSPMEAWVKDGRTGFLVTMQRLTSGQKLTFTTKVIQLERNQKGLEITETEMVSLDNSEARTIDHVYMADSQQSILLVNYEHMLVFYAKEGVSHFARRLMVPANDSNSANAARLINANEQLILVTASSHTVSIFVANTNVNLRSNIVCNNSR